MCVLHNLSYQIESELPPKYTADFHETRETRETGMVKTKTPGCFPVRSVEIVEVNTTIPVEL